MYKDFYSYPSGEEVNTNNDRYTYVGYSPFDKRSYRQDTFHIDLHCRLFAESDNGKPAQSYAYIDIDKDVNNGAMRDPVSGKWVIHPIEVGPADEAFIENSVQAKLIAKSRFGGQLDAVNATGYYRVENVTLGEETRRERMFSACLMHPPVVLCASTTSAGALREPRKSLVPYLIQLLQTVEFVD